MSSVRGVPGPPPQHRAPVLRGPSGPRPAAARSPTCPAARGLSLRAGGAGAAVGALWPCPVPQLPRASCPCAAVAFPALRGPRLANPPFQALAGQGPSCPAAQMLFPRVPSTLCPPGIGSGSSGGARPARSPGTSPAPAPLALALSPSVLADPSGCRAVGLEAPWAEGGGCEAGGGPSARARAGLPPAAVQALATCAPRPGLSVQLAFCGAVRVPPGQPPGPSPLPCDAPSPPLPSPSPVLPGRQGVRAAGPPSGACWRPESPSPDPWPWLCPRPRCRPSSEGSGGAGARAGLPAPGTDCTACPSPGPAPRAPCTSTAAPALSPSCTQRPRPSNGPAGSQGAPRGQRPLRGAALACPTQTGL